MIQVGPAFLDLCVGSFGKLFPLFTVVIERNVKQRAAEQLEQAEASQWRIHVDMHCLQDLIDKSLRFVLRMVQVVMEQEEHILLSILQGILTAVHVIKGASVGV
jgi:hypothetical protein